MAVRSTRGGVGSQVQCTAPGDARSFWLQEALAADPGRPCPPLERNVSADVCIVGGGFAGLWTANELVERESALRVALVEADICGGGASGRNGGFLSSSWHDLDGLCGIYGEAEGVRYASALADQIDEVGAWCARTRVDAWFHKDGVLAARAGAWQPDDGDLEAALERRGLGDRIRRLSATHSREIADSPRFLGGSFVPDNAIVQPARLARGLRRVALERGVRIYERTHVQRIDRATPAIVRTPAGAVRADRVVITVGAWAAAWAEFRRTLGNIADYVVVTEPIPERIRDDLGWTSWTGIVDRRELLYYLRRTDDGRIAIGGGSTGVLFDGRIGRSSTHDRRVARVAAEGLVWLFPQLRGVRFTHAWGGPIDMTPSFTPFFHTLAPGNVHAGLGFSGHGLAATKLGGKTLASLALGLRDEWSTLPVVGPPVGSVPPEPFRWPLVRSAVWGLESGDRAETGGSRRGRLQRALAWGPIANRRRLRAGRRRTDA
jgi:glycine/D-amino acid oxidase-like deaminating enzyme